LEKLWDELMTMEGGWVLEIDVRKFFDTLDHGHLRQILSRRVRDGVLLRLIGKWLNAGVLEQGEVSFPDAGSPQGGVISPILANVYLHEVLDVWFAREVLPRLQGRAHLIRYADDALIVFASERDARRVLAVLPKRFAKYGLTLHPEKTRLIEFRRPDRRSPSEGDRSGRPGTFNLLGFTHFWAKSRRGNWVVKRKTARDRFGRALKCIAQWCRSNRHLSVGEQRQKLEQKLRGHFGYYGITGNYEALHRFREGIKRAWCKWLNRRSQKASMTWERMSRLLQRYPLPQPRILRPHSSA
jgi:group II intron reverse transcriptase/maturase